MLIVMMTVPMGSENHHSVTTPALPPRAKHTPLRRRVTVMVSESNGYGVREQQLWCYLEMVIMLHALSMLQHSRPCNTERKAIQC
jgi:hypothetical protein